MLKRAAKLALRTLGLHAKRSGDGFFISAIGPPERQREALVPRKFSAADVELAMDDARSRWQDRNIVVLSDQEWQPPARAHAVVRCWRDAVSRISEFDAATSVFLYACESDDVGLPYVQGIVEHRGLFFPVQVYTPSSYAHVDGGARTVLLAEHARQSQEGIGKFDFGFGDALNLMQAIAVTAHLEGDYLEVGCFRGSSACIALSYMREIRLRRNCYFLDVFDGFTYEAAQSSSDVMWAGTHGTEGISQVEARISARSDPAAGLHAKVLKTNIVEDRLPEAIESLAVANIDVDLYEAVLASLVQVAPKMVASGIIVVEDPGHTPALIGSRLALQQFLETPMGRLFIPFYLESGQTFLVKTGSTNLLENA